MTSVSSTIELVKAIVPAGSRILDIGCGSGEFAAKLLALGYAVTGVEPQEHRIAEAQTNAPGAVFHVSGAEKLPFDDASFDAATMVHSLHHVPPPLMRRALDEAMRCLKPGAALIVVEPPPEGSFHEVFKLIDDETGIRNQAQAALDAACRDGLLRRDGHWHWENTNLYADVTALIEDVAAVDAVRRERSATNKREIERALMAFGKHGPKGYALTHPIRADVFRH
ncbi:MAG: methyltransferase domain-containing protein [Alphaproteobacteria bacterium]|nr:methyltransferase domain-containing protein [Alphaproteobacteria bacterium]